MGNPGLECLLGLACNDFTMLAADQSDIRSIMVTKSDVDKIHAISDNILMGVNGESGDTAQFSQYIAKNIQLYRIRNGYPLDTAAAVHFTRKTLSDQLRTGSAYSVNLLYGGYDEKEGGQLYYMDFIASCVKVPFAAHGFAGMLSLSILAENHRPTLTEAEAYNVMKLCIQEIYKRLCLNLTNFVVKVVNKKGIRSMPTICPATFFKGG